MIKHLLCFDPSNGLSTFGACPLIRCLLISKLGFGFGVEVYKLRFFNHFFVALAATEVPPALLFVNGNNCSNNYARLTLKMVETEV